MKKGETIFFTISALLVVLAISSVTSRYSGEEKTVKQKDYYVWSRAAEAGYKLYKQQGCNSCHRVLRMGEAGVAPVLDGEGTRRSSKWLREYFRDPEKLVAGSAHTGKFGPDFRMLTEQQRMNYVAFMTGLKSNPGSSNYPLPP